MRKELSVIPTGLLLAAIVGGAAWWVTSSHLAKETKAEAEDRLLAVQTREEARVAWEREGRQGAEFNALVERHFRERRSSRGQSEGAAKAMNERHRKEIAEFQARWK